MCEGAVLVAAKDDAALAAKMADLGTLGVGDVLTAAVGAGNLLTGARADAVPTAVAGLEAMEAGTVNVATAAGAVFAIAAAGSEAAEATCGRWGTLTV